MIHSYRCRSTTAQTAVRMGSDFAVGEDKVSSDKNAALKIINTEGAQISCREDVGSTDWLVTFAVDGEPDLLTFKSKPLSDIKAAMRAAREAGVLNKVTGGPGTARKRSTRV